MKFLSNFLNWVYPSTKKEKTVVEPIAPIVELKEEVTPPKKVSKKKEPKVEEVKTEAKKPSRKKPTLKVEK